VDLEGAAAGRRHGPCAVLVGKKVSEGRKKGGAVGLRVRQVSRATVPGVAESRQSMWRDSLGHVNSTDRARIRRAARVAPHSLARLSYE
jgi:hypothetical protein